MAWYCWLILGLFIGVAAGYCMDAVFKAGKGGDKPINHWIDRNYPGWPRNISDINKPPTTPKCPWMNQYNKLKAVYPVGSNFLIIDVLLFVLYYELEEHSVPLESKWITPIMQCCYRDNIGKLRFITFTQKSFPFLLRNAGFDITKEN